MRKIFKRYIIVIFIISTFLTVILTSWWSYKNIVHQEKEIFKNIVEHLKLNITVLEEERIRFEDGLKKDYLLKVKLLREYINYSPNVISDEKKLKEMANLLDGDEIYITDEEGKIVGSSLKKVKGLNLKEKYQLSIFDRVLNSRDLEEYFFQELPSLAQDFVENKTFIGMKRLDGKGIVQIELFPQRLVAYKKNNIFSISLDKTTIAKGVTVFILDKNTGEILAGIYGEDKSLKEYLQKNSSLILEEIYQGKNTLLLQNKKYFILSEEYKNWLIVRGVETKTLYTDYLMNLFLISVSMLVVLLILIFNLKNIVDKKILLEVENITKKLENISKGDLNLALQESNIIEMNKIVQAINSVVAILSETNIKFESVVKSLNLPIGIFFYKAELKNLFITDGIQELLNLPNDRWRELKNNKEKWLEYLKELKQTPNEEEICLIDESKYIKLILSENKEKNEYYGMIQDVTQEQLHKKEILEKLEKTSQIAQKDYLTGVLKKEFGILEIERKLYNNEGVFLIFDLDNFKSVNDTFGHSEGDYVLVEFTKLLKENFTKNSIISRMGGDEFSVFIDKVSSVNEIEEILKNIFSQLEKKLLKYVEECNFSMSVGGVFLNKEHMTYDEIYHQADKGLYKAKRRGKKQYYFYEE